MTTAIVDLNTLFPGKPDPATFAERADAIDWQQYAGQRVQLRGCAPSWAHLIVAARVLRVASGLEFLIDTGAEPKPVVIA